MHFYKSDFKCILSILIVIGFGAVFSSVICRELGIDTCFVIDSFRINR